MSNMRRLRHAALIAAALLLAACSSRQSAPVIDRAPGGSAPAPAAKPAPAAPAAAAPGTYVVKRGDTLYGIALDHGLDYKDLAAWNGIANPNLIQVDQVLRLSAPGTPAAAPVAESGVVVRPVLPPGGQGGTASPTTPRTEPSGAKRPYSDDTYAGMQKGETAKPAAAPPPKPAEAAPASAPKPSESDDVAWAWPAKGQLIGQFSESGGNKGIDIAAKVGDPVLAAGPGRVVYAGQGLRGYGRLIIIKHNDTYLSAYAHNSTLLVKEGQNVTRGQKIAEAGNTDSDVPKLHFEIRRQGKPADPMKFLPEAR